jgi:hypothetical protein
MDCAGVAMRGIWSIVRIQVWAWEIEFGSFNGGFRGILADLWVNFD